MKYKITLKDKVYEVEVEHGDAMLLSEYEALAPVAEVAPVAAAPVAAAPVAAAPVAAAPVAASGSGKVVPCPLPGVVVDIKVSLGQVVKAGDLLMIVEAMKMENDITAPFGGKVVNILVTKGAQVGPSAGLVELA